MSYTAACIHDTAHCQRRSKIDRMKADKKKGRKTYDYRSKQSRKTV
ncbi:hypothetical protein K040078D81_56620 [Blautia hominis]|uniref:Uncharacterized protein n=1 Tax=Blautia hominis TaxID=2025493 RepID=A0ABQ0BJB2_9FIRM